MFTPKMSETLKHRTITAFYGGGGEPTPEELDPEYGQESNSPSECSSTGRALYLVLDNGQIIECLGGEFIELKVLSGEAYNIVKALALEISPEAFSPNIQSEKKIPKTES